MPQPAFTLKPSTTAILWDDQRTMVTIPDNELVTLVVGDIDGDEFVAVSAESSHHVRGRPS